MRAGFRRIPLDLILGAAVAVAVPALVLAGVGGPLRYALALVLVFLLPGYGIVAILFPKAGELEGVARIALSVGLSIASVALVGVLLDATPWGVTVPSVAGALLVLSLGTLAAAGWRRLRVPEPERLALSVTFTPPRWRDLGRADRLLAAAVALALVSGVGVVAFGLANPPAADRYTEFYLLDPNGGIYSYPLSLNTSQEGAVIVGVHDLEGIFVNYTVVALLVSLVSVYNATTGTNQTVVGNTTFLGAFQMPLASGATGQHPFNFSIAFQGSYLLEFHLYKGAPDGPPYRAVDLPVRVT